MSTAPEKAQEPAEDREDLVLAVEVASIQGLSSDSVKLLDRHDRLQPVVHTLRAVCQFQLADVDHMAVELRARAPRKKRGIEGAP